MTLYRLHIRPKGGRADQNLSFAYCLEHGVLGMGWRANEQSNALTWGLYETQAAAIHGNNQLNNVRYLKREVKPDDLIWTRDTEGRYYLAKVLSGWEYLSNPDALDADILNVVRCIIIRVPTLEEVPGKVIAAFRATRALQSIHDESARIYSQYLWNQVSQSDDFPLPTKWERNLFSFLDAEQTEDVVFLYLQFHGWLVIPHSRKADTMSYEYLLIHRESRERAIVQVKTGRTPLFPGQWQDTWKEKVILFQSNGIYSGPEGKNVECISPHTLEAFMHEQRELLPSNITFWLDLTLM